MNVLGCSGNHWKRYCQIRFNVKVKVQQSSLACFTLLLTIVVQAHRTKSRINQSKIKIKQKWYMWRLRTAERVRIGKGEHTKEKGVPVIELQGSEWTSLQNVASGSTKALGLEILTALKLDSNELIA